MTIKDIAHRLNELTYDNRIINVRISNLKGHAFIIGNITLSANSNTIYTLNKEQLQLARKLEREGSAIVTVL